MIKFTQLISISSEKMLTKWSKDHDFYNNILVWVTYVLSTAEPKISLCVMREEENILLILRLNWFWNKRMGIHLGYPIKMYIGIHVDTQDSSIQSNMVPSVWSWTKEVAILKICSSFTSRYKIETGLCKCILWL